MQILARRDHYGRISDQTEVENHASPMLHPGAVTSQGLVARICTQILAKQGHISSRFRLDSIRNSWYDFCG
jgi:hypothetical protein